MEMLELIINLIFVVLAVGTAAASAHAIAKIIKLNRRFNAAIVLIPLYKKSRWAQVSCILLLLILVADVIFMLIYRYYVPCICVMVIIVFLIMLLITMMKSRCAVLDSGIVVTFKFIDWTHLYDYEVKGNTIFFYGDTKGNDTLASVTPTMTFDESNAEKLNYILSKYRIEH